MARGAKEQGESAQVPPTRQTGAESATGVALQQQEKEIPQGEDRGSKVEIEGGDSIRPDAEAPEATGAQIEPARYTSNGQLPHNQVPTPTGSVPVGATGLSVEDARKRTDEVKQAHDDFINRDIRRQRIPAETVSRLHPAELRAIAGQRGYDLGEGGTRSTRDAFLRAQDEDDALDTKDEAPEARGKKSGAKKSRR